MTLAENMTSRYDGWAPIMSPNEEDGDDDDEESMKKDDDGAVFALVAAGRR